MLTIEIVRDDAAAACSDDSPFASYVERVREGVTRLIDDRLPVAAGSSLRFVCLPLVGKRATADAIDAPEGMALTLDSPWLRLARTDATPPRLHITFTWSERQMLIDQARLAGLNPAGDGRQPLSFDEYQEYLIDYERHILLAATPEDREAAQAEVETRIPAEMLWLFRLSLQSTRGPFGGFVEDARRHVTLRYLEGYTEISLSVFKRCATKLGSCGPYREVYDVSNLVSVNAFRIEGIR